jgi:hypothetical protein
MKRVAQTIIAADRYYTIANYSGKVIEGVEAAENGAAVQLANYSHKPTQEWAFLRVGEGVYRLQNRGTGKMLDLMMCGTADGTWLHQWEDANCSSQMWIVEPGNDGRVKIRAQLAPAKCVDIVGMSTEAGARLQIWQDVNGENQMWKISEAAEKKTRGRKPAAEKNAAPKVENALAEKPAVKEEAPAAAKPQTAAEKAPAAKTAAKPSARKPRAKRKSR